MLDSRVVSEQVVCRDLADVRVVEYSLQCKLQAPDVVPVRRDEQTQIFREARKPVKVQRCRAEHRVADAVPLQLGQNTLGGLVVYPRRLPPQYRPPLPCCEPRDDALFGLYTQPAVGQTFEVTFVRER
jgi:hypothetical protein